TNASVMVTVNKATLTVTADNLSRYYGVTNPTLTYQIASFVNNNDSSVVSGTASLSTSTTPSSAPKDYTITVDTSTLSASNYTFHPTSGPLTVQKPPLTTTAATINGTVGGPVGGTLATFTTPDLVDSGSAFTATVTWGDGSTTNGVVMGS